MEPDPFLDHLRQVYGVRIDLEWDEPHQNVKCVKCSGHWVQIQQLRLYLQPSSPAASSQPSTQPTSATVTPPAPAPAPAHIHTQHSAAVENGQVEPMDTSDMDASTADATGRQVAVTRGASDDHSSLQSSTVDPSTSNEPTRHIPVLRGAPGELKVHTSAKKSVPATVTSSSSPPQASSFTSPSSSGASSPTVPRSSSGEETREPVSSMGARPKESRKEVKESKNERKKTFEIEKFQENVPASDIHAAYLQNCTDRLQMIQRKLGSVSIESTKGGFKVGAMTEKDWKRASTLLKDELKALEDITDTHDIPDDTSDSNVQTVISCIRKDHPEVLIMNDKAKQQLVLCGNNASSLMEEAVGLLQMISFAPTEEKCRSEDILVEKDVMAYLTNINVDKYASICKENEVEVDLSPGDDFTVCVIKGKEKKNVEQAARRLQRLVEKYSLKLVSENVLFSPAAYKGKHRQFEEIEKTHKHEVLFCYDEAKTTLYLVGEEDPVKATREHIEAMLGTKRKRGNSLRRGSRKLDTAEAEKLEPTKYTKVDIERLTKTMGAQPSRPITSKAFASSSAPAISKDKRSFEHYNSKTLIHVLQSDITRLHVDMIVNSANGHLRHQAGVAKAIAKAAGPELTRECDQHAERMGGYLQKGSIFVSSAGGTLLCKFVLHAVSPPNLKHDPDKGVKGTAASRFQLS